MIMRVLQKKGTPPRIYPTPRLALGQSFVRIIETKTGAYDWLLHNRIRSAVYRYMRHGGKGKKFSCIQERRPLGLTLVVTRTE